MYRVLLTLSLAVFLAGCSISANTIGLVGRDGKEYRGIATGYMDRTGTIEMTSADGSRCAGEFRYTGTRTGSGILRCSDGKSARVQFNALGQASGYGYGATETGEPVRFTYGLSELAAAPYLNPPTSSSPSTAARGPAVSQGTGFFINGQGHILTNEHVVEGCSKVAARLADGTSVWGEVIADDPVNDLAVILAKAGPQPFATFSQSAKYRPGDSVVAFGFPLVDRLTIAGNLTTGTLSALSGMYNDSRHLQISAPVQPGNSGGPLADMHGQVIGVVASKLNALKMARTSGDVTQNVNFAIKDTVAKDFLKSHSIPYVESKVTTTLSAADVGDIMRKFTVLLACETTKS